MAVKLVRTIAEHTRGNHRITVSAAAKPMTAAEAGAITTHSPLDETFYVEVFGVRRAKRGRLSAHAEWEEAREPSACAVFVDGAPPRVSPRRPTAGSRCADRRSARSPDRS